MSGLQNRSYRFLATMYVLKRGKPSPGLGDDRACPVHLLLSLPDEAHSQPASSLLQFVLWTSMTSNGPMGETSSRHTFPLTVCFDSPAAASGIKKISSPTCGRGPGLTVPTSGKMRIMVYVCPRLDVCSSFCSISCDVRPFWIMYSTDGG